MKHLLTDQPVVSVKIISGLHENYKVARSPRSAGIIPLSYSIDRANIESSESCPYLTNYLPTGGKGICLLSIFINIVWCLLDGELSKH